MAFITPVVRKDFNLYSKKKSHREQKKREPMETVHEIAQNDDDQWEDSLGRKLRLELMRERRLRHYNQKLRQTHVLRKISEISNEAMNDDELVFDQTQNGFTIMRRLTEGEELEEKHRQWKENNEKLREPCSKAHSNPDVSKPPKYGAMLRMFQWMSRHSLRGK
ncbi:hypothetical protein Y032_0001g409 [Ancylostoma ceylanicum]|uniref:Uncharacterized protein n=1 Tax=Ancylostoma ceylanicum TaxID=53326 RepID=A0A016W4B2_9BILA|nr:hypothetical protein Y032_0001g409 [Ancylostoma ceylanicum]